MTNVSGTTFLSLFRKIKRVSGYAGREIVNEQYGLQSNPIQLVEYEIPVPPSSVVASRKLFFFSDLHYSGPTEVTDAFSEVVQAVQPDWIVFGGDIVTYACFIDEALAWLGNTFSEFNDIPKFAVPGNWDRRRARWFPNLVWYEKYEKYGFRYLLNDGVQCGAMRFYGLDDARGGRAELPVWSTAPDAVNCIISHSADSFIMHNSACSLAGRNLVLCGHTHGGQIRIPGFGALFTSSRYWKLFEYGRYRCSESDIDIIITSGIGMSRLPFRLFCPSEAVVITFCLEV